MEKLAVAMVLLLAFSGVKSECLPQTINTTTPSGPIIVLPTAANDTCTVTFNLTADANLYLTLTSLKLPEGGSIAFNEPGDTASNPILTLTASTDDVQVVYTKTNLSTVVVSVGPHYKPGDLELALFYTIEACAVTVKSDVAKLRSPVYLADDKATTSLSCIYSLSAQSVDQLVALTFGSFALASGEVIVSDGTTNVTYTDNATSAAEFVGAVVTLNIKLAIKEAPEKQSFVASYVPAHKDCSGMKALVAGESLVLTSPEFPNPYPAGVTCRTIVSAPQNTVLRFDVLDADFSSPYDQLAINDGSGRKDTPLLVLQNLKTTSSDYFWLSTGNQLWVNFMSIVGAEKEDGKGFNMTIRREVFGGAFFKPGNLELKALDHDTRKDPDATDVFFQLRSEDDKQLTVTFSNLTLGAPTAFISIYDGLSTSNPMIARFRQNEPLYPVFSSGEEMLIQASGFLVNGSLSNTSFFTGAFVSAAAQTQNKISTGTEGSYSLTEKFPMKAQWLIQNPNNDVVELALSSINLGENRVNVSANVTVYSGLAETDPILVQITPASPDKNLPKIYVQSGVRVSYSSEGVGAEAELLLQGSYRIIAACGEQVTGEREVGDMYALSTPYFPDRYPFNADCNWNYTIPKNRLVHVSFANFDLAQNNSMSLTARMNGSSDKDAEKNYGVYGGSTLPDDLIVEGDDLLVAFSSKPDAAGKNDWNVAQGVMANLRMLNCGENQTSSTGGSLSSPPTSNTTDLCVWIINVPAKGKAEGSVNILEFDLTITKPSNDSFSLILKDGPSSRSENLPLDLGKLTKVQSRYNQLYVEYEKPAGEAKGEGLGFTLKYNIYECPSNQQCSNGVCMHKDWECNGVDNCGDFSDEKDCSVEPGKGKKYGAVEMFIMFVVALVVGIALALCVPVCYRKIRSRYGGEGTGYGNLHEEPVV